MRRPKMPEIPLDSDDTESVTKRCAEDGCIAEGIYPAPKSRQSCAIICGSVGHVRAYNKSWNYYEGLQGAALEAEIRRATTWERPTWKFATGKPGEEIFDDSFSLFEFENREDDQQRRKLTPEERRAWQIMRMKPIADLEQLKKQYKQLAKENHPDRNGGDEKAEERLKDQFSQDLICKSLNAIAATPPLRCN